MDTACEWARDAVLSLDAVPDFVPLPQSAANMRTLPVRTSMVWRDLFVDPLFKPSPASDSRAQATVDPSHPYAPFITHFDARYQAAGFVDAPTLSELTRGVWVRAPVTRDGRVVVHFKQAPDGAALYSFLLRVVILKLGDENPGLLWELERAESRVRAAFLDKAARTRAEKIAAARYRAGTARSLDVRVGRSETSAAARERVAASQAEAASAVARHAAGLRSDAERELSVLLAEARAAAQRARSDEARARSLSRLERRRSSSRANITDMRKRALKRGEAAKTSAESELAKLGTARDSALARARGAESTARAASEAASAARERALRDGALTPEVLSRHAAVQATTSTRRAEKSDILRRVEWAQPELEAAFVGLRDSRKRQSANLSAKDRADAMDATVLAALTELRHDASLVDASVTRAIKSAAEDGRTITNVARMRREIDAARRDLDARADLEARDERARHEAQHASDRARADAAGVADGQRREAALQASLTRCSLGAEPVASASASGPAPRPEIAEGQSVTCGDGKILRYTGGELRHYPSPEIAGSWDPNWSSPMLVNCEGIPRGAAMESARAPAAVYTLRERRNVNGHQIRWMDLKNSRSDANNVAICQAECDRLGPACRGFVYKTGNDSGCHLKSNFAEEHVFRRKTGGFQLYTKQ